MKKTEYLSNDILEESHLKLFSPFRVVQIVLGSCRVDARDRFVTSPTKAQKLYTVFCVLLATAFYANILMNFLTRFEQYRNIFFLTATTLFLHYATFASNIVHVRFMNNQENVKFYIKTQEIDRKLKINGNKCMNEFIFKANLFTVVMFMLTLLVLFTSSLFSNVSVYITFIGLIYGQLTTTLEWLYCSNMLIFFYIRLRYINAIITNHIEGTEDIKHMNVSKVIFPNMKVLRFIASSVHDFQDSETEVYLKDIFDELLRFQNLHKFQIFLFCSKFVLCTLLMFEYGLLTLQKNILIWQEVLSLLTISTVDLILVIIICVRCESFAREIKKTKYLCNTILSLYYAGPLRRKALKMLKLITEKPPRFSVYDMWHMDPSTMIHMINLVTTLMVTLLQFALL